MPGIWPSLTFRRSISRHIDRMFRIAFGRLRRPELTACLTRLPRACVLVTQVGRAERQALVLLWATSATSHRHTRRLAPSPLLTTRRLHSWHRGSATQPTMLTGHGLRFPPMVCPHIPWSRGVDGGPPAPLALPVPPAAAHSLLVGHVHFPASSPAARGGVSGPERAS